MARRRIAPLAASLTALAALVTGCSTRTNVAATGDSPALYTHVYVTAQAVWFNASASAGPDDAGWVKFTPSTPVTLDLVADSGGNFANLATDLKLTPGSYSQLRFIPVDASTPLTVSAQTLGALYNMEADFVDSAGVTHQLPLELLNPDKGLGIQANLSVPIGNIGAAFGATSTATTTTPVATTGTTTASTTSTSTTGTTATAEFGLTFDGVRDLTAFTYGGASGVLLSSHVSAYDLSQSGGIQGQLTLTNLTLPTSANGTTGLEVSAQVLSADGTRYVVVARAPVASDGSFTLYPLAANSSNNTSYDLVIHGPGIATIIVKSILIPATGSSGVSTTGVSTTGTTTNPDTSPITPANLVSIGTLIPRAATTYTANITTAAAAPLPAGAEVDFYETLPSAGEVPYVIEAAPIDPFNQVLANAQSLSTGTVDSGTYVSTGATITVVSAAPAEGAGTYQVAADAPLYADGALGTMVAAPTTAGVTTAGPVQVATLALAAGNSAASVAASVQPSSAGKYDHGELMLSQNGQLIASAPIDAALAAGGGTVQLAGVPGGTPTSVYYVSVRAWNSSDPSGTLTRQWYPDAVDLSSASSANVQVSIN
ncbi:MAG TPA: DUF4382 domain-containing protein [Steroidobacteraceae bacterium]|nr:DUF4382 domain-containing protein [Steroidobacteraceae bacterium]